MVKSAALIAATCLFAAPVDACRLALVLAMDVSSSVDAREDQLQRSGLVSALIDPDVQAAFFISPNPVALYIFEWSGRYQQQTLQDWIIVDEPETLFQLAQRLANSTRQYDNFPTAMGYALGHAAIQLTKAPACMTQTIDLAGDGVPNDGFGPKEAYAAFPFDGVTVNGLVVTGDDPDVLGFYQSDVKRGGQAFIEVADGFDDYAATMRRKLLRELTAMMMGGRSVIPTPKG